MPRLSSFATRRALAPVVALCSLIASAGAQTPAPKLPLKLAPRPTTTAITPADLMTRLYQFADDSMMGRQVGREGNMKGTAYIAREVQRLGLEPAGDNGTYFQNLPYVQHHFTPATVFTVDGKALKWEADYIVTPTAVPPRAVAAVQAIYGGVAGDTTQQITAAQATGKFVVLKPAPRLPAGGRGAAGGGRGGGGGGGGGRGGFAPPVNRFAGAAAVATVDLDALSPSARALINNPQASLLGQGGGRGAGGGRGGRGGDTTRTSFTRAALDSAVAATAAAGAAPAGSLRITTAAATQILGGSIDGMSPGAAGKLISVLYAFEDKPLPQFGRNVVAILRGSDPALRGQFVAIGAHNDHVGFNADPVSDHDSLYAFNHEVLRRTMHGKDSIIALTPEERAEVKVNMDSLRRLRPARKDSIRNGADDDGSGSMAVLEIAEALSKAPQKPKRSIIFVWHTGEEAGLTGSRYFTDHPTVPRDSIVTQINIDMIGRGRAEDIPGGGDDYLGVVGARRLSTDLGDMVRTVNGKQGKPLALDYRFDEDVTKTLGGAYNNIYGRSDHANYARYNIPIAFFFTGLHADYHQVTDEPQYIDYPHYARITNYIRDLLVEVGNRPTRPVVDKPTQVVP